MAVSHLAGGFARHIDGRFGTLPYAHHAAQSAVALFFVISGCVMVISSKRLFGQSRGTVEFWRRRVVRVMPPYWIATALFLLLALRLGLPAKAEEVARSLLFIPYRHEAGDGIFLPFLWPGWTLFYEMIFYILFGCFVFAGRTWTIALTSLALMALTVAGELIANESIAALAFTRPVLLLFIVGMFMGVAIERGLTIPGWARIACLVLAGYAMIVLPAPASELDLSFTYALWAGFPAVLLFVAALGGTLALPFSRAVERAGDASYAIYLLHVPFAHAWMLVFNSWLRHPGGSIGYLVAGVPLLLVLSIAFHRYVEIPMTSRLNALLGGARQEK